MDRVDIWESGIAETLQDYEKMEADAKKMPELRSVERVDVGESGIADTLRRL